MTSHVVVDGSNLATEGRKTPSLDQLIDAVDQFAADRPHDLVTVICDASFPNRIDEAEKSRYDELVNEGRLITPPAGAIGRGDAFILQVATKAGATVLSNDSFQEFHGQHPWLFEEGRLVGGKPVAGVGWIFVDRSPVRGPTSRKAVREAERDDGPEAPPAKKAVAKKAVAKKTSAKKRATTKSGAKSAASKEPGTKKSGTTKSGTTKSGAKKSVRVRSASATKTESVDAVPDGAGVTESTRKRRARKAALSTAPKTTSRTSSSQTPDPQEPPDNNHDGFDRFVAAHPVGSQVAARVVSFGSHGAYTMVDDVSCYVPLKAFGDPAPRSVKDVLAIDEEKSFVVAAVDEERRRVDLGLDADTVGPTAKKRRSAKPKAKAADPSKTDPAKTDPAKTDPAKKRTAKKRTVKKRTLKPAAEPKPTKSSGPVVKRTRVKRTASPK